MNAPGIVAWGEQPDPAGPSPLGALVAPVAVATCDFDHLIVGGHVPTGRPTPLGHEFVAEIVETGDEVTTVARGDLVVVPFQISCGSCPACRRGLTSSCASVPWLSCYGLGDLAGSFGGAVADRVAVPYADAMLVPLPDTVAIEDAAALGCNIVDAYRCVGPQLAGNPGAPVLIVSGAFANIALYATALALALGAPRVDFFDHADPVAHHAERLGATIIPTADDISPGAYPITVDASMDPALLHRALTATTAGGECTASTMYFAPTTPLPLMTMFERCLTFRTGQPHARALLDPVLALLVAGAFRPRAITTSVVDWEDAPTAFAAGCGKTIVTRTGSR